MNEKNIKPIAIAILLIGFLLFGCCMISVFNAPEPANQNAFLNPTSTPEPTKEKTYSYKQIYAISGKGAKNSETFTISGSKGRVKYDCKITNPNGGVCSAFLKKDGQLIGIVMNSTESTVDETIIDAPGNYLIQFNTIGGEYSVVVEDYLQESV